MEFNNDYTNKSYYVEHDDFFKYIREYLQERNSHVMKNNNDSDISSDDDYDDFDDDDSEYDFY